MQARLTTLWERSLDVLLMVAFAAMVTGVIAATMAASHWPLVGDESLMHYVVLLMERGRAPYREIIDFNLPGSYVLDALTMRWLGGGAGGLRIYDGMLCAMVGCGCVVLSRQGWRGRVLGGMAGLLFGLIHLRDGLNDGGQRDLAMSALLLLGYVILLRAPVRWQTGALLGFEFVIGLTLIIKPTLALMAFVPLVAMRGWRGRLAWRRAAGAAAMLLMPALAMGCWLWRWGAVWSFWNVVRTVGTVHQQVARQGTGRLLSHALDPMVWLFVGAAGLAILLLRRARLDGRLDDGRESATLLVGAGVALLSVLLQAKGFPYQRYPLLVLALILSFRVFDAAWAEGGWVRAAVLVLVTASAGVGGLYAKEIRTYDRYPQEVGSLRDRLKALRARDGEVQCLDTTSGCVNALYDDGLTQATGYLYDCYAYAGAAAQKGAYRAGFMRALEAADAKYLVISSQRCLAARGNFNRVAEWPELAGMLEARYRLSAEWGSRQEERWWSRRELPFGYEVWERRGQSGR